MAIDLPSVAIFTDQPGWHGKQLQTEFSERGFASHFVSLSCCTISTASTPTVAVPNFASTLPDGVFVRGIAGGSLQEVVFYLHILHILQSVGVPIYNNTAAIEKSVDKSQTGVLLQQAGIRTPPSWTLNNRKNAIAIIRQQLQQGRQLVAKPLFGSCGKGVLRIRKLTDLLWLRSSGGIYYLQQFVPCLGEDYHDIRVFVLGGVAVAAMRRRGVGWLNNVAQGARCEALALDDNLANIAVSASRALDLDYAGVDIIVAKDETLTVIEVNSIPAWRGIEGACKINIAALLVQDLTSKMAKSASLA